MTINLKESNFIVQVHLVSKVSLYSQGDQDSYYQIFVNHTKHLAYRVFTLA